MQQDTHYYNQITHKLTTHKGAVASFTCSALSAIVLVVLGVLLHQMSLPTPHNDVLKIGFVGDIVLGRGIDYLWQVHNPPNMSDKSEREGNEWALEIRKKFPNEQVPYSYIFGDMLPYVYAADLRIFNLETVVTTYSDIYPDKPYPFRMHPVNLKPIISDVFKASYANIANNHIMDYYGVGCMQTVETLRSIGMPFGGAGANVSEAAKPTILTAFGLRIGIFSMANQFLYWAATENSTGLNFVYVTKALLFPDFFNDFSATVKKFREENNIDLVILTIHWGQNWKVVPPDNYYIWAHKMIDDCYVDIIHGHSSHTIQGIEVYKNKLIMYSNGNFVDDYSSGPGQPAFQFPFHAELSFFYMLNVNITSKRFISMELVPSKISNFQVNRANVSETQIIFDKLNTISAALNTAFTLGSDGIVRYEFKYEDDDN